MIQLPDKFGKMWMDYGWRPKRECVVADSFSFRGQCQFFTFEGDPKIIGGIFRQLYPAKLRLSLICLLFVLFSFLFFLLFSLLLFFGCEGGEAGANQQIIPAEEFAKVAVINAIAVEIGIYGTEGLCQFALFL